MTQPTIVFDLDGTLIDTAPDLLASLNHCLLCEDMNPVEAAELRRYVGMGARVMIQRAFAAGQRDLDEETLSRMMEVFLDHYTTGMPGTSAPYPGLLATLDRLEDAGYAFAICTNKLERLSVSLVEKLEIAHRFRAVCGADTFAFRKPDPRHLLETIAKAGGVPSRSIMVGDSRTDIDTAKAAGIPVVAVDFGYTDRHVREFEPSHIISHYDELSLDLVERLLDAAAS
ncbi:HAD-IA family hydrolase [Chelativorans sp. ZYF759]|uniref:phosphoglycolate phosphatase n=1 Tax=Chelativorans sp. ZYF759 TaxID=2692213 RepID=UPI00145E2C20|nr:phosphoglycolate phosphatase [Chelativorans sp. ZYF759]NMG40066.1 HAD-IA family hydrolase [Chelativorans sp. ZYF759]